MESQLEPIQMTPTDVGRPRTHTQSLTPKPCDCFRVRLGRMVGADFGRFAVRVVGHHWHLTRRFNVFPIVHESILLVGNEAYPQKIRMTPVYTVYESG